MQPITFFSFPAQDYQKEHLQLDPKVQDYVFLNKLYLHALYIHELK